MQHELPLGNGKDADIYFETFDDPSHNFIADITTASDRGLNENNPFEALSEELSKRVTAAGLKSNYFDLKVEGGGFPTYKGGPKITLKLPGRARFGQVIFNQEFDAFLSAVLSDSNVPRVHRIKNADADVTITYQPGKRFGSGSYPSYSEVFRITENTIYTALESKARKIDGATSTAPFGILLCDNDCSLFRRTSTTGLSYSIREVIQHFLRSNPDVAFVITFTTERERPHAFSPFDDNPYLVLTSLYRGMHFESRIRFDLPSHLEKVLRQLPEPERTPGNAINLLRGLNPQKGTSHNGGMHVKSGIDRMTIKISSRALLGLLSGKVSQKEFFETHRFAPSEIHSPPYINPFLPSSERGLLIDNIAIEKSDTEDDDWIIIELSKPDPAVSPFVIPNSDASS